MELLQPDGFLRVHAVGMLCPLWPSMPGRLVHLCSGHGLHGLVLPHGIAWVPATPGRRSTQPVAGEGELVPAQPPVLHHPVPQGAPLDRGKKNQRPLPTACRASVGILLLLLLLLGLTRLVACWLRHIPAHL